MGRLILLTTRVYVILTLSVMVNSLGSPQDVSFVSSDAKKRRKRPPTPLVDSTLLRFLSLQKTQQVPDSGTSNTQQTSITIQQQQPLQPSQQQPLGQYNRHLVATQLSELQGVSPALAIQAGNAVQQHVLAENGTSSTTTLFTKTRFIMGFHHTQTVMAMERHFTTTTI